MATDVARKEQPHRGRVLPAWAWIGGRWVWRSPGVSGRRVAAGSAPPLPRVGADRRRRLPRAVWGVVYRAGDRGTERAAKPRGVVPGGQFVLHPPGTPPPVVLPPPDAPAGLAGT